MNWKMESDVDMKMEDESEEAKESKEDEGMKKNGGSAGLKVAELDELVGAVDLEQKPRW